MSMKIPKLPAPPNISLPRKLPAMPKLGAIANALPARSPSAPVRVPKDHRRPEEPSASIWRTLTKPVRLINWRIVTAALFGVGILHIVATLAAPSLAIATAYNRLEGVLPANSVLVLPQIAPGAQPLPFMSPALRYAMCRFDTTTGPVDVSVELSETGSSLTIYSVEGEAIYTAAQSDVALHRVRIVPADGRFLGLTPEARGRQSDQVPSATLPADRGIVVYALPDRGVSYLTQTEQLLRSASCRLAGARS
jgi:uncharacterized membrane protein